MNPLTQLSSIIDFVAVGLRSCFAEAMDKENKDKLKKKKIVKKEREESEINNSKTEEKNVEVIQEKKVTNEGLSGVCQEETSVSEEKETVSHPPPARNPGKFSENLRDRGRNTPEVFYIAHPRNIKRTAHFKDVHSRKLSELLEAFHMFDFDRDGVINHDDLRKTFASLCADVTDEEIDQMLSEGLNPLNFDAFVILLGYKTLDLDPEEVLLDALSNWDDHQEGLISYDRLLQQLTAWGDKFTEGEATAALADAPIVLNRTKEKMIDYIQFSEDLCGLRKMMQRKTNRGGN